MPPPCVFIRGCLSILVLPLPPSPSAPLANKKFASSTISCSTIPLEKSLCNDGPTSGWASNAVREKSVAVSLLLTGPGRPSIEWNILNRELFPKGKEMVATAKSEERYHQQ